MDWVVFIVECLDLVLGCFVGVVVGMDCFVGDVFLLW